MMTKKGTRGSKTPWGVVQLLAIGGAAMIFALVVLLITKGARAADVVVYKSPTCGCCTKWVAHLKEEGFTVAVEDRRDLNPVKARFGVPRHLQSCHTAEVGDYIVEGHVPADLIQRMLEEKPDVRGLTVPGMPMGSPGMEGPRKDAYSVLKIHNDGTVSVYAER